MRRLIRGHFAISLLSLLLVSTLAAADAAARERKIAPIAVVIAPTDEQLPELEEILVNGRRLAERITTAEDEFFALYNQLNRNNAYEMYCGLAPMQAGSRIMLRGCAPGFLFEDYGAPPSPAHGICTGDPYNNGSSVISTSSCFGTGYVPPSRHLVMLERQDKWAAHMMKMIHSDARLLEMATGLDGLYRELQLVRSRFHPPRDLGFPATGSDTPAMPRKVPRSRLRPHSL